ncbi:hypothetical protein BC936DRAFT_146708 [Jimgerdemannia flammicorona]|uniref:Thioredoxin domain-containing protein n=1 Tax=Jimgerdemannia flammicorona TaxID=994334 RepID=A0A433D6Y4_9FUNG|nr:hypothetical protein BC936DRAFT_146708 [Jimgerdemannia flammicorona]
MTPEKLTSSTPVPPASSTIHLKSLLLSSTLLKPCIARNAREKFAWAMWGTTINSPTVKPSTLVQHPTTPLYTHRPSMPITTFRTFTFRTITRVPYPALLSRTFIPRAVLPTLATPSRVAAPFRAYTHAHDVPVRPMIQKPAPKWSAKAVVNGEFQHVSLDDYKGKFLVMVFYPADFTFVCPTELIAFSDRSADFNKLGAQVVGISVDNAHSHLAWVNTPRKQGGLGRMEIPLGGLRYNQGDCRQIRRTHQGRRHCSPRPLYHRPSRHPPRLPRSRPPHWPFCRRDPPRHRGYSVRGRVR